MELASEAAGAPMQVGAVLVLDTPDPGMGLPILREAVADRISAVPRMRQRLVSAPFGCGPPYWVDDPAFDIDRHVRELRCPAPGDERALLDVAAQRVMARLPHDRPLWSATLVTNLAGGRSALIVVFHHVLSDGIGGLAVLSRLVDGAAPAPDAEALRRPPTRGELFVDAIRGRLRAAARLPIGMRQLRHALGELKPQGSRAPRCSLNQPTGQYRRLAVARADLASVRAAAHAHDATLNDVVLTAVTGSLHRLLRGREEDVGRFVVSIPVSARRATTAGQLGNQVGVLPVELPATGDPARRLDTIAAITRKRKTATPGASATLLAPAFRLLARLGGFRWYVNHQRRVTTFVTNLRGPDTRLSFLGVTVAETIPVTLITGNVTVAFAAMSYAGTLVVTVIADSQRCPDAPLLVDELQRELDALTGARPKGIPGSASS